MAQIILTVPDDKEQRFIKAFATVFGWSAEIADLQKIASQNLQTEIDGIEVD